MDVHLRLDEVAQTAGDLEVPVEVPQAVDVAEGLALQGRLDQFVQNQGFPRRQAAQGALGDGVERAAEAALQDWRRPPRRRGGPSSTRRATRSFHRAVTTSGRSGPCRTVSTTNVPECARLKLEDQRGRGRRSSRWASSTTRTGRFPPGALNRYHDPGEGAQRVTPVGEVQQRAEGDRSRPRGCRSPTSRGGPRPTAW